MAKKIAKYFEKNWQLWVMLLPAMIYIFIFCYIPMYGVQLAFREYSFAKGFLGGDFVGFKYFKQYVIVKFKEFKDINEIEPYKGRNIYVDREHAVDLEDDELFVADLLGLKVKTKKGTKLGHITDFSVTSEDFIVQQIIVKRPIVKAIVDPELTSSRKEIVEVNDYEVIVKDEEKVLKARAEKEDFVPNFVNPFREQGFAPAKTDEKED